MYDLRFFEELLGRKSGSGQVRGEFAIMAPFVEIKGRVHLLFEVRAMSLRRQPGEVCFPGGKIEKGESPVECAVRETFEELGVPKGRIRLIGNLGTMRSLLDEEINVFAGEILDYEKEGISTNPSEVGKVFAVPFEHFMKKGPRESFPYEGNDIWGLTARAVNKIIRLCEEEKK